jgi:hypothetical protein
VLAIFNLAQVASPPVEPGQGAWRVLLDSADPRFDGPRTRSFEDEGLTLAPCSFVLFERSHD